MIWTAYKAVLKTVVRCMATVVFRYDAVCVRELVDELDRLGRIIKCIRQSYALHPSLLERIYKSTEGYLEQHLAEADWRYWTRQTVTEPVDMPQMQRA